MDLFEYQGKELFARHGIPVPSGEADETPEAARAAAERIGGRVVVKAQVQVGGRGKAGGIKLAENPDEAEARALKPIVVHVDGANTVVKIGNDAAEPVPGQSGQRRGDEVQAA